jgi:AraC-like DNA-binding protein
MTRLLLYDYDKINVSTLCRDSCLSQRQIERKLKDAVGVSPKNFQQISRFEALIKELLLNHQHKYLDIAMDYGYYDQSHFLKEFKKYVGESPSSFLQAKNFMSNFYNRKLRV